MRLPMPTLAAGPPQIIYKTVGCNSRNMKKIILILLFLSSNLIVSQNQYATKISESGKKMSEAIIANDYETLADFTYPVIIEMMGGRTNMIQATEDAISQMRNQGYVVSKIKFGKPENIFDAGDELHCLMPQTLEIKNPKGTIINNSYLIAVSKNQGEKWYFVDTADLTNENIHKLFPNFNSELSIPMKKAPEFIPN